MFKFEVTSKSPVRAFQLTRQDKEELDKFNDRWDQIELPRLIYRYDVGRFVAEHIEGYQGRKRDVLERLAEELPHHPTTLRTYASVPMAFAEDEFYALIHRKTSRGNRVCWTHPVLLARVPDASVRERFIQDVFEHDLRTLELRERIRAWEMDRWSLGIDPATVDHIVTVPFMRTAESDAGPFAEVV